MIVKQYDTVLLKDGREASIVEIFDSKVFIVDVGSSPEDWETIEITIDDIAKVLQLPLVPMNEWYKYEYVAKEEESLFNNALDKANIAAEGHNREDICGLLDIDDF